MNQQAIFTNAVRHVAALCAVAALTAPKSGGQLLAKGAKPFIETEIVEDPETLARLAAWLRERGKKLKDPIWFRDADVAEKLDLVLFIGLAHWYPRAGGAGRLGVPRSDLPDPLHRPGDRGRLGGQDRQPE